MSPENANKFLKMQNKENGWKDAESDKSGDSPETTKEAVLPIVTNPDHDHFSVVKVDVPAAKEAAAKLTLAEEDNGRNIYDKAA